MVAHIIIEAAAMVIGITVVGYFIGKLFKEAEKEDQNMVLLSMTQGWMIGIIAMMCMFGIAAGIFSAKGKANREDQ